MTERVSTDWTEVRLRLEQARSYWIFSHRPDGRPHAAPVWGVWMDGRVCFSTSPTAVKSLNLKADPRVVVHLESAENVVILEGTAELIDGAAFRRADALYAAKYALLPVDDRSGVDEGPVWAITPLVGHSWSETAFAETVTRWRFGPTGAEPAPESTNE